jgi:hypothetical protein
MISIQKFLATFPNLTDQDFASASTFCLLQLFACFDFSLAFHELKLLGAQ